MCLCVCVCERERERERERELHGAWHDYTMYCNNCKSAIIMQLKYMKQQLEGHNLYNK